MLNTCSSRDDKRYTERKNKTERARRKKEDITRVRSLVDLALAVDPRMKRIKQEEKEAREAKKKKGKVNGAPSKAQLEEQKRKEEEEAKESESRVEVYGCERGGGGGTSMSWMTSTVRCWWT